MRLGTDVNTRHLFPGRELCILTAAFSDSGTHALRPRGPCALQSPKQHLISRTHFLPHSLLAAPAPGRTRRFTAHEGACERLDVRRGLCVGLSCHGPFKAAPCAAVPAGERDQRPISQSHKSGIARICALHSTSREQVAWHAKDFCKQRGNPFCEGAGDGPTSAGSCGAPIAHGQHRAWHGIASAGRSRPGSPRGIPLGHGICRR
jgi:hypothetical protein